MKLWGVSMVRNESDIVEAFVRHNLSVLDGLVVVDHGSSDATMPILMALCAERLPLIVKRVDAPGYLQSEVLTTAAREAFATARADVVFPIDADEFVRIPSRDAFARELGKVPAGHLALAAWPTFVLPLERSAGGMAESLRLARRWHGKAREPGTGTRKAVLDPGFARNPAANLSMGSHGVVLGRDLVNAPTMPRFDLPAEVVEVCHAPVRSRAQFIQKIAVRRLARIAAGRDYDTHALVRQAFEAIRRGDELPPELLLAVHIGATPGSYAYRFAEPRDERDAFFADVVLRYPPAGPPDPLPRILAAVASLADRLAAARAAQAVARPVP